MNKYDIYEWGGEGGMIDDMDICSVRGEGAVAEAEDTITGNGLSISRGIPRVVHA